MSDETSPIPASKPEPAEDWLATAEEAVEALVQMDLVQRVLDDPVVWLVAGVFVLGAVIWFIAGRVARPQKPCRWSKDTWRGPNRRMVRWVCKACGADAYTSDNKQPKECKRSVRETSL